MSARRRRDAQREPGAPQIGNLDAAVPGGRTALMVRSVSACCTAVSPSFEIPDFSSEALWGHAGDTIWSGLPRNAPDAIGTIRSIPQYFALSTVFRENPWKTGNN